MAAALAVAMATAMSDIVLVSAFLSESWPLDDRAAAAAAEVVAVVVV